MTSSSRNCRSAAVPVISCSLSRNSRIRFAHPVTGEEVTVESPLPPELARFVARLDAGPEFAANA
jgi:hypothetical protein